MNENTKRISNSLNYVMKGAYPVISDSHLEIHWRVKTILEYITVYFIVHCSICI